MKICARKSRFPATEPEFPASIATIPNARSESKGDVQILNLTLVGLVLLVRPGRIPDTDAGTECNRDAISLILPRVKKPAYQARACWVCLAGQPRRRQISVVSAEVFMQ